MTLVYNTVKVVIHPPVPRCINFNNPTNVHNISYLLQGTNVQCSLMKL